MATQAFYTPNVPNISNNASTTTGDGTSYAMPNFGMSRQPPTKFTWQVITTGSPASLSVTLQGSIDGTTWTTMDTSTATAGETRVVANTPMKFIKTNVGTLTGGSSPTVTTQFVAAE